MSTKKDILSEAIADAKAVKSVAIANAKLALEESFTPHLKTMLSAKLQEMEEEEGKVDEWNLDGASRDYKPNAGKADHTIDEWNIDGTISEETEEEAIHEEEEEEGIKEAEEEESIGEINLDELLAELNEEEEPISEETEEEVLYEAKKEDDDEEEEEIDLEDMSEKDLKNFIQDVIQSMVDAGELEAGESEEGEEEKGEDEDEEVSIDEIINSLEEGEGKKSMKGYKTVKSFGKGVKDDYVTMQSQEKVPAYSKAQAEKVSGYVNEINSLKAELNEINVLNSKLLYVNKILKAKNLTESQKIKVLNSFDKAKTVEESKLVYETLMEGLKEKKTCASNLRENMGSSSKVIGNINENKAPILETNDVFARMKKLAGL